MITIVLKNYKTGIKMKNKMMKYIKEIFYFFILLILFANILSFYRSGHLVNEPLPFKSVVLLNQETYALSQDKPTLLYFWATWCPICKAQSPNIQTIAKNYNVLTVAVKSGSDKEIQEYLKSHNLDFKVINDYDGSIANKFGISVFPTTLLYDKDREFFYSDVGYTSTIGLWLRMWWIN